MKREPTRTSELPSSASTMPKCARGKGSGFVEIEVQLAPTVPLALRLFESTWVELFAPSKPPATIMKAVGGGPATPGAATAPKPENPVTPVETGSGVVVVQVTTLVLRVTGETRLRFCALLVPPEVTTVTAAVPGTVKLVLGTVTTMPVVVQFATVGTTVTILAP